MHDIRCGCQASTVTACAHTVETEILSSTSSSFWHSHCVTSHAANTLKHIFFKHLIFIWIVFFFTLFLFESVSLIFECKSKSISQVKYVFRTHGKLWWIHYKRVYLCVWQHAYRSICIWQSIFRQCMSQCATVLLLYEIYQQRVIEQRMWNASMWLCAHTSTHVSVSLCVCACIGPTDDDDNGTLIEWVSVRRKEPNGSEKEIRRRRRRATYEIWRKELFSAKPHGGRTTRAKIFHRIFSFSRKFCAYCCIVTISTDRSVFFIHFFDIIDFV